jgi:hypothetical protein
MQEKNRWARFFLLLLVFLIFWSIDVTKKTDVANLAKTKLALAEKCERLIKACKSKPRKENLRHQADRFRRQAEQCARM